MSVKVYLAHKVYKDGTSPVMLRFFSNNKYTKSLFKINKKHWSGSNVKRSHPNSIELNTLITNEIAKAEKYLYDCKINNTTPNPLNYLKGKQSKLIIDLVKFKEETLHKNQQFRTEQKYRDLRGKIKLFNSNLTLNLNVMDLKSFNRFMIGQGLKPNTRQKYFKCLKTVLRENGVKHKSPFDEFNIPSEKTSKVKLTRSEIKLFEDYKTNIKGERVVVDCFLFALYNWGMRIADVLQIRHEDIMDDKLIYWSDKSNKEFIINLSDKSKRILNRNGNGVYCFNLLSKRKPKKTTEAYQAHIESKTALVNNNLKKVATKLKIKKKISSHVARHTFAYLAAEKGISLVMIKDMLGHEDIKTTEIYLRDLRKFDRLNDQVKDLFS